MFCGIMEVCSWLSRWLFFHSIVSHTCQQGKLYYHTFILSLVNNVCTLCEA